MSWQLGCDVKLNGDYMESACQNMHDFMETRRSLLLTIVQVCIAG